MNTFKVGDKVRRLSTQQDIDWKGTLGVKRESVLTVRSIDGNYIYLVEDNSGCNWWIGNFELVESNIDDDFIKARELIGQEVYYWMEGKVEKDVVRGVSVINKTLDFNIRDYSRMVRDAFNDNEEVIILHITGIGNIPFSAVVDKPISKLVKLNDNYTAEVYKDKIVVGCQTFPINILDDLNVAWNSL